MSRVSLGCHAVALDHLSRARSVSPPATMWRAAVGADDGPQQSPDDRCQPCQLSAQVTVTCTCRLIATVAPRDTDAIEVLKTLSVFRRADAPPQPAPPRRRLRSPRTGATPLSTTRPEQLPCRAPPDTHSLPCHVRLCGAAPVPRDHAVQRSDERPTQRQPRVDALLTIGCPTRGVLCARAPQDRKTQR